MVISMVYFLPNVSPIRPQIIAPGTHPRKKAAVKKPTNVPIFAGSIYNIIISIRNQDTSGM